MFSPFTLLHITLILVLTHSQFSQSIPTTKNLFASVLGKSTASIDAKINSAWQHFFEDPTNKLYYTFGTDMAYILDTGNNDVRTEGMSYGMMICVQLNKKSEFDLLWKFARTKMQHRGDARSGYFAWSVKTNGDWNDPGSAPDGEEYFVTALFLAAARWGNGKDIYNYEAEANYILTAMLHLPANSQGVTRMFDSTNDLIVFAPVGGAAQFTDPSYHLPAFYTLWSKYSSSSVDRTYLAQMAVKSRNYLKLTSSKSPYGLFPDYANWDGTPKASGTHDHFQWDAFRVLMNIGIDYAWFGADSSMITVVEKLLYFFKSKGPNYGSLWDMNGNEQSNSYHAAGLVACNAAGTLAVNDNSLKSYFLTQFWDLPLPTGTYRYYDSMLYMLSLLAVTGRYQYFGGVSALEADSDASGVDATTTVNSWLIGSVCVAAVILFLVVAMILSIVRKKRMEIV